MEAILRAISVHNEDLISTERIGRESGFDEEEIFLCVSLFRLKTRIYNSGCLYNGRFAITVNSDDLLLIC